MAEAPAKLPFYSHSVTLDPAKCKGCTNCIKKCPTAAIRVRKGRATITEYRCVDCGECIRTCPYRAKKALSDPLDAIFAYDWKIALPAPALFGQFDERHSMGTILAGLLNLGFDEVVEVAPAAEVTALRAADMLRQGRDSLPAISSSCPAVLRLVQIRYPSLLDHVLPLLSPMELAARRAKARHAGSGRNVGVFFISPCAAKITDSRSPLGIRKSAVDAVIGIKDIYLQLRSALSRVKEEVPVHARRSGLAWARTEGESEGVGQGRRIAVDGMENVIGILDAAENGKLKDVDFIEAMACSGGCIGGPLCVENPYLARVRVREREAALDPVRVVAEAAADGGEPWDQGLWEDRVAARPEELFSNDLAEALRMEAAMEDIRSGLPGLDCGSCGAPTCDALAEDVVRGKASRNDCVFKLREGIRKLAAEMLELEQINPPGLDRSDDGST